MKKMIVIFLVFGVIAGGCGRRSENEKITIGSASADANYEGFAKGPHGEAATLATDVSLTPQEYKQIRQGKYSAAMLWAGAGEWYNALTAGASAEFEKLGIEIVAVSDASFDAAKQATDVETTLAVNPNIILSLPVDPVSGTRAFQPAVDAGVSLVFADNGVNDYVPGEQYVSIVTGDHYGMGRAAAQLMVDAIGNKGNIGVIYYDADFFVTNNRDMAFLNTIETRYPDINIAYAKGFAEENKTGEVAVAMVTQTPDLDGVYVSWDVAAEPVVAELRSAGVNAKLVTYDLGGNNDLDMAQGGIVYGKVADKPYQIGEVMARLAAYDLLDKTAPSFVVCETVKMTKDNMIQAWEDSLNKKPSQAVMDALE